LPGIQHSEPVAGFDPHRTVMTLAELHRARIHIAQYDVPCCGPTEMGGHVNAGRPAAQGVIRPPAFNDFAFKGLLCRRVRKPQIKLLVMGAPKAKAFPR